MNAARTVLSVSHRTTYRYSTFVETAQHLATIRPLCAAVAERDLACGEHRAGTALRA